MLKPIEEDDNTDNHRRGIGITHHHVADSKKGDTDHQHLFRAVFFSPKILGRDPVNFSQDHCWQIDHPKLFFSKTKLLHHNDRNNHKQASSSLFGYIGDVHIHKIFIFENVFELTFIGTVMVNNFLESWALWHKKAR